MAYLYPLISSFYLLVPAAALGWAGWWARRGRMRPFRTVLRAAVAGVLFGLALTQAYTVLGSVRLPLGQVAMTCYVLTAVLCVTLALNAAISRGVSRLFRVGPADGGGRSRAAQAAAGVVHALVLLIVVLPYVGSVLLIYRPKAPSPGNPRTLVDAPFETVAFRASDAVALEAWWIPACRNARTDGRGSNAWGRDTVVFCHGFNADKASQLFLTRELVANGYNVLAIDLRAHGRSGGLFTGFGLPESRDVLSAVHWLRAHHPDGCRRVLGLGESLGAVALIQAAGDAGPDGQAIDAIAAYNPYDSLDALVRSVAETHTLRIGQWVAARLALPLASAQVGANLSHFAPVRAVGRLWPRPILVLGNPTLRDPPAGRTFEFYRDALQPKYKYFRDDADRDALLHDDRAALTVRIFFDGERSII